MNLSTTYLGLKLKHPIVPSASPLTYTLDGIKRLADAGAPLILMHSLFEEQLLLEYERLDQGSGANSFWEAQDFFPRVTEWKTSGTEYLELIEQARKTVGIPLVASLNGVTPGGWLEHALRMEEAGASALELNLPAIPTDPAQSGEEVERRNLEVVRAVRSRIKLPLSVKLGPFHSNPAHLGIQVAGAGANGLTLFNRLYHPDWNLDTLEVTPSMSLSTSTDLELPLRWIALLYGTLRADLALSSGVHTRDDVLKGLMAGATVVTLASELLSKGPKRLGELVAEVEEWLKAKDYGSLEQLRGSMSLQKGPNPAALERAKYLKAMLAYGPKT